MLGRASDVLLLIAALAVWTLPASSERLRVATYNTELQRDGPGLLLRDILRGEDPQVEAVVSVIAQVAPDVLAVQGFDYDLTGAALSAFTDALRDAGVDYAHVYSARPNTGMMTAVDLDGDGRRAEPRDAQGYGRFSGQGGMAILSRHPILRDAVRDFSDLLWADFPDALLPVSDGAPFPSAEALTVQRLSTTAHWVVPVDVPDVGRVDLLTMHATPPVFDGPEDRNGRRNHDEIVFWLKYLDGVFGPVPDVPFVLLGDFNQDPDKGEGLKSAIRSLLADPRLQDTAPTGGNGESTVNWEAPGPGRMRVDYVLPSADWHVIGSGVFSRQGEAGEIAATASRHWLVWVDLAR